MILSDNLLHLAEWVEDRENQCKTPKNLKCRILGNNSGKWSLKCWHSKEKTTNSQHISQFTNTSVRCHFKPAVTTNVPIWNTPISLLQIHFCILVIGQLIWAHWCKSRTHSCIVLLSGGDDSRHIEAQGQGQLLVHLSVCQNRKKTQSATKGCSKNEAK